MAICMLIEWVRKCDLKAVCDGFTHFLKGMGTAFTGVVGLLVAAGVFAHGIKSIGAIDQLILMAEHVGLPLCDGHRFCSGYTGCSCHYGIGQCAISGFC